MDDLTPGKRRICVTLYTGSEIAARDLLDLPDEAECADLLSLARRRAEAAGGDFRRGPGSG